MTDGEGVADGAGRLVLQYVLADDNGRLVGYRRRPRVGTLFARFLPAKRIKCETKLLQELLCLALAALIQWIRNRQLNAIDAEAFLGRVLEICVDGSNRPRWPTFGFQSRDDAIDYIRDAITEYSSVGFRDLSRIFFHRMLPLLTGDETVRWGVYSVNLCAGPNSLLPSIIFAMDRAVGRNALVLKKREDTNVFVAAARQVLTSQPP